MTQAEIIKIIDTRLDLLNTLIAENTDFNLNYTFAYARAELEQLKIIIKYKEETKMANVIEYDGKKYRLIDNAEISDYTRIQIEDSICYLTGVIYEAPCVDDELNLYTAYWLADENAEMPEDACNWEKPDYIEREF